MYRCEWMKGAREAIMTREDNVSTRIPSVMRCTHLWWTGAKAAPSVTSVASVATVAAVAAIASVTAVARRDGVNVALASETRTAVHRACGFEW